MATTEKPVFDNDQWYRDLGLTIGYYRRRKGMTQEELAEKVGISRQHMGCIEAPRMVRGTSLEVVYNIARVLEIEPYVLFKFNPEK